MPGFGTSVPTTYLRARVTTHDGVELTFGNSVAPLAPLGLVAIAAFSYLNHSAVPWLFTPILLLFFLRDVWTFCYAGPRVRHELHLFGVNVWRSEWRLDKADSASADLM